MSFKLRSDFGFYAILTDPVRGYEYCTELMVARGVAMVQLRMKDAPPEAVCKTARSMRTITRGSATLFIVNDYPEIAVECEADGVHVGQGDMPYDQVRKLVGPDMLIGLSTHNRFQVEQACALSPDYIGIGPLYPTPTKKIPDPALGIEGVKALLGVATVPSVILGSITADNLVPLLQAGAVNFSSVRPINQSMQPEIELDRLLRICSEYRETAGLL